MRRQRSARRKGTAVRTRRATASRANRGGSWPGCGGKNSPAEAAAPRTGRRGIGGPPARRPLPEPAVNEQDAAGGGDGRGPAPRPILAPDMPRDRSPPGARFGRGQARPNACGVRRRTSLHIGGPGGRRFAKFRLKVGFFPTVWHKRCNIFSVRLQTGRKFAARRIAQQPRAGIKGYIDSRRACG